MRRGSAARSRPVGQANLDELEPWSIPVVAAVGEGLSTEAGGGERVGSDRAVRHDEPQDRGIGCGTERFERVNADPVLEASTACALGVHKRSLVEPL